MYNLFQVTQTLRSLRRLVTVTVTPYMRGYAKHIAMVYAIIGWLLYSHRTATTTTTTTTNDKSTIDEVLCQLRQGHIETTNKNNYITTEIKQNEHQNTSNIQLIANNITSNTVIKSVEELPSANKLTVADVTSTVLDSSGNKCSNDNNNEQGTIGYIKYWLGGFLMLMITAIPWDHSSITIQVLADALCISVMIITTVKMMKLVYSLLKGAVQIIDQVFNWLVVAAPLITNFLGITTNTFVVGTGFLVVMALDWDSSITCQSSQALVSAVSIHILISIVHIMVSIVYKILSSTSTFVGCAARGIIHDTANMVFGLVVFCGWLASGVVRLLRIRIRELGAVSLMVMITAFPWDHSSVVIQQLVDVLIISLIIITTVKMMSSVYTLLNGVAWFFDQVLEWVVVVLSIDQVFEWILGTVNDVTNNILQYVEEDINFQHENDNDDVEEVVDEQPNLRNYRAHPRYLSDAEIKEDVDLAQQAWYQVYNDANLHVKKKKLQINENKNDIQDIAGREEAEVSIVFLESIRHLISQLQQAAPAKFEKGSPLELLVRHCNAFHLLEDIFRLDEDLRALEKQVKKKKRLEKLEKKLQSDLVGWDVPQGRSRRIRKQRVVFSPAA